MLVDSGYRHFVVCVEDVQEINSKENYALLQELQTIGLEFHWQITTRRLYYREAKIDFLIHKSDRDLERLRGAQYDAAIVKGNPSDEFDSLLSFSLRLGEYPIKIKLS